MTCKFLKLRCLQLKCQSREKIEKQGLKLSPEPLENWNLDSAKAPAVRSIAKRAVLMQYGPLCVARTPGLWRSRNSNLLTVRGIKFTPWALLKLKNSSLSLKNMALTLIK